MTTYQSGDLYLLEGNSQSLSIHGLPKASVFIRGSNDGVDLYNMPQASVFINGSHSGATINGLSQALIVMNGSNDGLENLSSSNVTVVMLGHNETITQQTGSPSMTILGFNASDSLNIYGLLPNPNGMGFERPGTPVTAANLRPDGHGGWTMPLSSGSTTYVDFAFTKEATILAAHINVSARAA